MVVSPNIHLKLVVRSLVAIKLEMMVNGNQRCLEGDVIRDIQQNVDSEP